MNVEAWMPLSVSLNRINVLLQRITFYQIKIFFVSLPTHASAFRVNLSVRELSFVFRDEKSCYLESSV